MDLAMDERTPSSQRHQAHQGQSQSQHQQGMFSTVEQIVEGLARLGGLTQRTGSRGNNAASGPGGTPTGLQAASSSSSSSSSVNGSERSTTIVTNDVSGAGALIQSLCAACAVPGSIASLRSVDVVQGIAGRCLGASSCDPDLTECALLELSVLSRSRMPGNASKVLSQILSRSAVTLLDPTSGTAHTFPRVRAAAVDALSACYRVMGSGPIASQSSTLWVAFTSDCDLRVRHAAILALSEHSAQLASRGLVEVFATSKQLLHAETDPLVRIAALKVLETFAREQPNLIVGGKRCADVAFIASCESMADVDPGVRTHAAAAIGRLGECSVDAELILQVLSKEVMASSGANGLQLGRSSRRVREAARRKSSERSTDIQYDPHSAEGDVDMSFFDAGARSQAQQSQSRSSKSALTECVGAAVLGLEDEFFQVRASTVLSLEQLATRGVRDVDGATQLSVQKFILTAVDFLVDMLNDELEVVRLAAAKVVSTLVSGLNRIAYTGDVSVKLTEEQLDLVIAALQDQSQVARAGIRNLLGMAALRSPSSVLKAIRAIIGKINSFGVLRLSALPSTDSVVASELQNTFQSLASLGRSNPEFCGFLVRPLLTFEKTDRHTIFKPVERDVGDISYVASLIPLINAAAVEQQPGTLRCPQILSLLPDFVFTHLPILREMLPWCQDVFPRIESLSRGIEPQSMAVTVFGDQETTMPDNHTQPSTSHLLFREAVSLVRDTTSATHSWSTAKRYFSRVTTASSRAARVSVCRCVRCSATFVRSTDFELHSLWAQSTLCQTTQRCCEATQSLVSSAQSKSLVDTAVVEQLLRLLYSAQNCYAWHADARGVVAMTSVFRTWRTLVCVCEFLILDDENSIAELVERVETLVAFCEVDPCWHELRESLATNYSQLDKALLLKCVSIWSELSLKAWEFVSDVVPQSFGLCSVAGRLVVDLEISATSREQPVVLGIQAPHDSVKSKTNYRSIVFPIDCMVKVYNISPSLLGRLALKITRPATPWHRRADSIVSLLPVSRSHDHADFHKIPVPISLVPSWVVPMASLLQSKMAPSSMCFELVVEVVLLCEPDVLFDVDEGETILHDFVHVPISSPSEIWVKAGE